MPSETTPQVVELGRLILDNSETTSSFRYMVGICGYPGAGKTSLSLSLADELNKRLTDELAAVIPMDGFHLPNSLLDKLNLRPLKGIPDTFDAIGFVNLLEKLRLATNESVFCPAFDRSIDAFIENAIEIRPNQRILIVEGNYLLLQTEPWNRIRSLLDEVLFLDTAFDVIESRLIERHILGGRSPEDARAKVESTDLPNAKLIKSTRPLADRVINLQFQT